MGKKKHTFIIFIKTIVKYLKAPSLKLGKCRYKVDNLLNNNLEFMKSSLSKVANCLAPVCGATDCDMCVYNQ